MQTRIPIDSDQLAEVCRRHHIKKLWLFGSVLREDFRADSDVDVLAEFEPGESLSFSRLFRIERELADLFGGHRVEIIRPQYLNRWIKDRVLKEAEVQYGQG